LEKPLVERLQKKSEINSQILDQTKGMGRRNCFIRWLFPLWYLRQDSQPMLELAERIPYKNTPQTSQSTHGCWKPILFGQGWLIARAVR